MPSKVNKWLAGYKPSPPEACDEFASWMYTNLKLLEDMEELLEKLSSPLVPDVCQRLSVFYLSPSQPLRRFTAFLLPSLIHSYLSHLYEDESIAVNRKMTAGAIDTQQANVLANLNSLEACLIGISKQSLLHPEASYQTTVCSSTRIPSLAVPSVFHDSVLDTSPVERSTPQSPRLSVNASQNRIPVISFLLRDYLNTLTSIDLLTPMLTMLSLHSMKQFCKLCDRIANVSKRPRIPLCPSLMCDMLKGLDSILYRLDDIDKRTDSVRRTSLVIRSAVWGAVKEIEKRATYTCLSGPLLICRALLHSRAAQYGSRAVVDESVNGVIEIGSLLTTADDRPIPPNGMESPKHTTETTRPRTSTTAEVITNAAFRPEIVPEDISVTENMNSNDKATKTSRQFSHGGGTRPNTTDTRHRHNGSLNSDHSSEQAKTVKPPPLHVVPKATSSD